MKRSRRPVLLVTLLALVAIPIDTVQASHSVCYDIQTDPGDSWATTGNNPTSPFVDTIDLSDERDVVNALAGDDDVTGNGGNDLICGGPGQDHLYGSAGVDHLRGNLDPDFLFGNSGGDVVRQSYGHYGNIEGGYDGDNLYDGADAINCIHGNGANDHIWDGHQGPPESGYHDCIYGGDHTGVLPAQGGTGGDWWYACPPTSLNDVEGVEAVWANFIYCDVGND